MRKNHTTPYGTVTTTLDTALLAVVSAQTDMGSFWGQGYLDGSLRLWQVELARRLSGGELSEVLGKKAVKSDIAQRRFGLKYLAMREESRVNDLMSMSAPSPADNLDIRQQKFVKAYVEGLNTAITQERLPAECLLLHFRPKPFSVADVYRMALLKYFINSAWQYELFHSRLQKKLNIKQAEQLFGTWSEEGTVIPYLPRNADGQLSHAALKGLADATEGLTLLGLGSPDTGSNVFAVSAKRSATGYPLLAADPHMGHVNPGFTMLCHVQSDEGLNVAGARFPGIPGVVIGRNTTASWGMVGLMADNQDLFWAPTDLKSGTIQLNGSWEELQKKEERILVKGTSKPLEICFFGCRQGRLIYAGKHCSLFLRWPALDAPLGDIVLYDLAKCNDWQSFRKGVSRIFNAPVMAGYADSHGDIGLQAVGLFPKRSSDTGCLLQKMEDPASLWQGYADFNDLPTLHNPEEGYILYANQYSEKLFGNQIHISNRWHPPARALRIKELIEKTPLHTEESIKAIQDDMVDVHAGKNLCYLEDALPAGSPLKHWDGDTRNVQVALMYEDFMLHLGRVVTAKILPGRWWNLYSDFWPAHKWHVMSIIKWHMHDWGHPHSSDARSCPGPIKQLVRAAHEQAQIQRPALPLVSWKHALRLPLLNELITPSIKYFGGNRETIHATRQNIDFLTTQSVHAATGQRPFLFGPAVKLISNLNHECSLLYAGNSRASGNPFALCFNKVLQQWAQGQRHILRLKQQ